MIIKIKFKKIQYLVSLIAVFIIFNSFLTNKIFAQNKIEFAGQSVDVFAIQITENITRLTLSLDSEIHSVDDLPFSPFLNPEFTFGTEVVSKDNISFDYKKNSISIKTKNGFIQTFHFDRNYGDIKFKMDEYLFGLGLGNQNFNRVGHTFPMRNGQRTGEQEISGTRLPISVLYSPEGWGMWFHQPEGRFDLSGETGIFSVNLEPSLPQYIDIFFFTGNSPIELVHSYSAITGYPAMPPKWALGYMQSHRTLDGTEEVLSIANTMREKELPCDGLIYLGRSYTNSGWNHGHGSFDFDTQNFNNPKKVLDYLHDNGFRVFMHVTGGPVEHGTYKLSGTLTDTPENTDGITHVVNYWNMHRELFNEVGVDAWWADDGDRLSREDRLARLRMYYDGYLQERPNQRPIYLTRTGAAGMQRYSGFLGSGDTYAKWETLRTHIPVFLNASVSGLTYIGSCTGGFWPTTELDGELYTRWFQFSSFTPYFRSHGRTWHTRLPWGWNTGKLGPLETATARKGVSAPDIKDLNNPDVEPICRKYLNLRYQLLPYTYTLTREAYDTGMPLMQPLWLHYPKDMNALSAQNEFLWGKQMLIAPVVEKDAKNRQVYLPEGIWYDFWTEEKITGGKIHTKEVDLSTMPIYIPAGSILPLQAIRQYVEQKVDEPLEIRIYPGKDGRFNLYDDDGSTENYKKESGSQISFNWQNDTEVLTIRPISLYKTNEQGLKLLITLVGTDVKHSLKLKSKEIKLDLSSQ